MISVQPPKSNAPTFHLLSVLGVRGNNQMSESKISSAIWRLFREAAGARRKAVVTLMCSGCLLAILLSIFLAVRNPAVYLFSCSSKKRLDIQCLKLPSTQLNSAYKSSSWSCHPIKCAITERIITSKGIGVVSKPTMLMTSWFLLKRKVNILGFLPWFCVVGNKFVWRLNELWC